MSITIIMIFIRFCGIFEYWIVSLQENAKDFVLADSFHPCRFWAPEDRSARIVKMSSAVLILKAVISREKETSVIKNERQRLQRISEAKTDGQDKSFHAHGIGIQFNLVENKSGRAWFVASMTRMGRASLGGE